MIYDKERLDAAYANVSLFADTAWQDDIYDGYVRANQGLWSLECTLKDPSDRIGCPRSVLDTIPDSRLAEYGTYLYDDDREEAYESANSYPTAATPLVKDDDRERDCTDEMWLSPEVEKLFCILTDTNAKTTELEERCIELISDIQLPTQQTENFNTIDNEIIIDENIDISDLARPESELGDEYGYRVCHGRAPPRGTASTFSELVLQMQLHSEDVRSLWSPASQQLLNVNVPEFYPKYCPQMFCQNIHAGPESVDQVYVGHDSKMYCDFNALLPDIQPWLNHSYPTRASDFQEMEGLEYEVHVLAKHSRPPTPLPPLAGAQQQPLTPLPLQMPPVQQPTVTAGQGAHGRKPKRRLYSAVLQNQTPAVPANAAATVNELDELEREALEQYRPSVESLTRTSTDSIISAKFQELERLALEQYSGSASSTDTYSTPPPPGNAPCPPHEPPCGGGRPSPYAALMLANSVLAGFYRSVANTRILAYLGADVFRFR